jgi:hypothetical protein
MIPLVSLHGWVFIKKLTRLRLQLKIKFIYIYPYLNIQPNYL